MPERSCPSCGLEVAAHQTLCPRCRTAIPSDAGPVAPSADGSAIRVAAPPPRPGRAAEVPPATDGAPSAEPEEPSAAAPGPSDLGDERTTVTAGRPAVDPTTVAPGGWGTDPAPAAAAPPGPAVAPASAGTLGVSGAPTLDDRSNVPGGLLGVVGAVLLVVGVVLPWLEVAGETVSGWTASTDAEVLAGVAAVATVAAALVVGGARSLVLRVLLGVAGVVALALGAFDLVDVGGVEGVDASVGVGLYVVLAGGLVLVAAAALTRHRRFR